MKRACIFLLSAAWMAACSSPDAVEDDDGAGAAGGDATATPCATHEECDGDTPLCLEDFCSARPGGWQLGIGDGTAASVGLAWIYAPDQARETTDIGFDPLHENRLWVLMREYESSEPCGENDATQEGCESLEGITAIIDDPGTEGADVKLIKDPNAWHFMRRPTGIAFGQGETFATCGEARTGNYTDGSIDYMGPTLWSSNLDIYGIQPAGKNGSHLDMLHATPWCMGIAWEAGNIYWMFNGDVGAIDRVDFHGDHGPGNDDHSDGEYWRYAEGQFSRVPNVPSHMFLQDNWLYVADTGNARVVRLDVNTGAMGAPFEPMYDPLSTHLHVNDVVIEEVVPAGTLQQPSGLIVHDGVLFVSDYATSMIHAYSLEGEPLNSLQLDMPPGSITGLEIGPDERIYFAEKPTGSVYQIIPF